MEIRDNLSTDTCWEIIEQRYDAEQLVTNGSNYMTGNGYLGYRGTFPEWTKEQYVGCTVTDTWDNADGKWTELCTVPNALYLAVSLEGGAPLFERHTEYARSLNFRYGVHRRRFTVPAGTGGAIRVEDERFASYANLHIVPARMTITTDTSVTLRIVSGIDADVWSLNGDHYARMDPREADGSLAVVGVTGERGVVIAVHHGIDVRGGSVTAESTRSTDAGSIVAERTVTLEAGESLVVTTVMSVYSSNDVASPDMEAEAAVHAFFAAAGADAAGAAGAAAAYAVAYAEHRRRWDEMWAMSEIEIDGDPLALTLLRYNMYQNFIATPAHSDHLPIGARGLSCQAYQGAAFWDQEIFNLPVYLYSRPEVARNILVYRWKTIDGARRKARDLGYRGAFYAWISADTGEEICPSFFFKDVLTGRPIHNHFNDWQIHVSPDIAYTVWKYYLATGDVPFLAHYGAEIVFEVMRFLASHAFYKVEKDRYEFIRLLGPDEYHENVDNNFFTAYQARYVARRALELLDLLSADDPESLALVRRRVGLADSEIELWREMAEKIHVPDPDPSTGVIEQFDGFFGLEDITPGELATRLQDPGEYWGWPNGIAVETQVSKQADVTQLFALHPHAYDVEVMRANYRYYESRTQHGSSLSYSVYAMVAAWIGDLDEAHRYFIRSCSVDLMNTGKAISGGTFIGGIHTAACGVAWPIVVSGFAGVTVNDSGLSVEPHLPEAWSRLRFPFVYRGNRVQITVEPGRVTVAASSHNAGAIRLNVGGRDLKLEPGASQTV